MLNMKETAMLVLISALIAVLTAGLIRGSWTYNVELVSSPSGNVVTAPAREPFNISCQVLGGDQSNISFMKWLNSEGKDIGEGTPGVVKREDTLLFLTFTDPKPEDSGMYKCSVLYANEYNLEYEVNIVFYGPAPEFELRYENLTVTEGERVEIYCTARGEKPMEFKWYNKAGDNFPEIAERPIYVSSSMNGSWLIIKEVKLHHQGMYTCSAKNGHGLSSKLYYIGVSSTSGNNTGNDTSIIQDIKIVNVSANSVQLMIPVSGFVEYIEVKYRESRDNIAYRRTFPPATDNIYSIEDLVPAGSYSFQFRILPSENNGTWSQKFQVTLLPDVPEIIFHRMEKGNVKLEWFRKVDDIMRGTIDEHEITYYSVRIQTGGNTWMKSTCDITIQVPSCAGSSYTISGLQQNVYYQIEVRAHTTSGYGDTATQKIYVPA